MIGPSRRTFICPPVEGTHYQTTKMSNEGIKQDPMAPIVDKPHWNDFYEYSDSNIASMKVFALLLVFLTAYTTARPSGEQQEGKAPWGYVKSVGNTLTGWGSAIGSYVGPQINNLASTAQQYYSANLGPIVNPWINNAVQLYAQNVQPRVSVMVQSAQQYIQNFVTYLRPYIAAGAKGAETFLTSLHDVMQQQIQNAGPMSLNLLTNLVQSTIQFAVSNDVLKADDGERLFSTFVEADKATAEPFTQADIASLEIDATFQSSLIALLDAKTQGSSQYALLANLETALMRLLAARSIVKAQAVASTMSAIGLAKAQEACDASLNFLVNLKNQIAQSETVKKIAEQAPEVVDKATKYVNDLSVQFAQSQIVQQMVEQAQQLLEQAPELYNSSLNYAYDLKDQVVQSQLVQQLAQNAPQVYQSYKASVDQMVNQMKESKVVQDVALAAPQYKDAFVSTLSNVVDQMAQNKIVQLTLQKAPEYYTASLNLLTSLQSQLAEKAPEVYDNLKAALLNKLAAGGEMTKDGMKKGLQGLLGLSANKYLLESEDAARLAACFGIDNGAAALTAEQVDQLAVKGDAGVAGDLKASIKTALAADQLTLTNLSAVNAALLTALAKNGLIDGAAALGLNTIIGA